MLLQQDAATVLRVVLLCKAVEARQSSDAVPSVWMSASLVGECCIYEAAKVTWVSRGRPMVLYILIKFLCFQMFLEVKVISRG